VDRESGRVQLIFQPLLEVFAALLIAKLFKFSLRQ
jgi:hypothetical protein